MTNHKKFVVLLGEFLQKENLSIEGAAYVIGCHKHTVAGWTHGGRLPNRDNAVKLMFFIPSLRKVLEEIAGVEQARFRSRSTSRRKLKAA